MTASPGAVETAMYETANDTPEKRTYLTNLHALKRVESPDELAHAALYLASDASSFQSGTAMLVDGGLSITRGSMGSVKLGQPIGEGGKKHVRQLRPTNEDRRLPA